jgi:uncharacterized protein
MQFLVLAYDHKDPSALDRRLAARDQHVNLGNKMRDAGELLYAVAILSDDSKMIGSVYVLDVRSRQRLDEWFASEPYVKDKVWDKIEVLPCRVGPSFSSNK